jgi:transposase
MMKVLKCTQRSASVLLFVTGLVGASIPASDLSAQEKIKLRDALVRSRVALINSIRFTLKSLGHTISNPSSQRFHKTVMAEVPQECRLVIAPVVRALEELSQRIKELDASLAKLAAERYPQTIYLQQVSGVGPITALYFVLEIGDPNRFERTRDVGAFVGLCPRRDQSGETDKELRISNAEMLICADCWSARRNTSSGRSEPTAPCASKA